MIRDVAELREQGQVGRRIDELEVDVATWRAGMRRAARREGMRIRTFVVESAVGDDPAAGDDQDGSSPAVATVYAVRTDRPADLQPMIAAMDRLAADRLGSTIATALQPPAPVTSITEKRARRSAHRSIDP